MKSYLIYALILFYLVCLTLERTETLEKNNITIIKAYQNETTRLDFNASDGKFYINIIALENDAKLKIIEVVPSPKNDLNTSEPLKHIEFEKGNVGNISFNVTNDTSVEITYTTLRGDNESLTDPYYYKKIEYNIDTQIDVTHNNFVIFLENENVSEKFDMKFKFNESCHINKWPVYFGFLFLPNDDNHYIALGKKYKNANIGNIVEYNFTKNEDEIIVNNSYYKKQSKDGIKTKFAFIFSIDKPDEMFGNFSFSINSEIINIFLIVSIVIALVFAVITFFLIRRKQSSESSTIENTDGLLKDGDKGENEGKDENEGKEDEEKDEKEEKKENEEKDEKEDDNVEEEKKKIKAAEN